MSTQPPNQGASLVGTGSLPRVQLATRRNLYPRGPIKGPANDIALSQHMLHYERKTYKYGKTAFIIRFQLIFAICQSFLEQKALFSFEESKS